jgi:DNA recombination protein RmuC
MDKLKKQLNTAANTVDETSVRTRAMERKLRTAEELPAEEASVQIGLPDGLPVIQQNGGED